MKLLAIETSTESCSAAAMVNDEVYVVSEIAPRRHNEIILSMCEQVLAQGEISITQLDLISFGRGPGSFTGVRLAASVTQGIALAQDLPVVPVSSLAALAQAAYKNYNASSVFPCIDARMQEVYYAVYQLDSNKIMQLQGEEKVINPSLIDAKISEHSIGIGSGWDAYTQILHEKLGNITIFAHEFPQAEFVAQLGNNYFVQGQSVSAVQAIPVYIRDNVAVKPNRKISF